MMPFVPDFPILIFSFKGVFEGFWWLRLGSARVLQDFVTNDFLNSPTFFEVKRRIKFIYKQLELGMTEVDRRNSIVSI